MEIIEGGNRLIRFDYEGIFEEKLEQLGEMPLPPYITHKLKDKNRYQTVYAKHSGSAAAPTAGLHLLQYKSASFANKGKGSGHCFCNSSRWTRNLSSSKGGKYKGSPYA